MSVTARIAQNINKVQNDNFYFTVLFITEDDVYIDNDSFSLSNIVISGSSDVSISDLSLLYVESNFAVISVDLPNGVSGSFRIEITGIVVVNGNSETLVGTGKSIAYDVPVVRDIEIYNTTPPTDEPTEVKITLSAASINNSGIIIAQFDFDYGVPYFHSDYVTVSPGVTKSQVEVIDDNFRRWIMLVTMPSSGQGMIEISVDEDAIGFSHDAVRAEVQHSSHIELRIYDPLHEDWDDPNNLPTLVPPVGMPGDANYMPETDRHSPLNAEPMIGEKFEYIINIVGNSINLVDVSGLLQPFYHHWDATTGKLYIRSLGEIEKEYKDFNFKVSARDNTPPDPLNPLRGVVTATFDEPMTMPPSIVMPDILPLVLFFGEYNEHEIEITNRPTKIEVEGTWLGLTQKTTESGIAIIGDIPERGSAQGEAIPGRNSGEFVIKANNKSPMIVSATMPWQLFRNIPPEFVEDVFTDYNVLNAAFTDVIQFSADPPPTEIVIESGTLPTGLSFETSRTGVITTISFTGTTTATGTFTFKFKVTNSGGTVISPEYRIVVYTSLVAPTVRAAIGDLGFPAPDEYPINFHDLTNDRSRYFNLGSPPGVFSISGPHAQYFSITPDGLLSRSSVDPPSFTAAMVTVTVTNNQGSASQVASILIN